MELPLYKKKHSPQKNNLVGDIFLGLAVFLLILVSLLISLQVFFRNFFLWSIPDAIILFENFAIVIIFFPLTVIRFQQIRVSFFYNKISFKKLIHTASNLFAVLIAFVLWVASLKAFWHTWQVGSYYEGFLQIPEYPVRFLFCISIFAFLLSLLWDLFTRQKAKKI